ncbi:hypothetical protein IRJ41_011046 [Triplophysa rosa]|uniref:Uncharacterized protein n=1 Tax=Triplophysa rosa TaxID=992332 RepID=A0A9W7T3V3_TRIRA|nr:hypothetical protein IRJ41_011046 [Triplophysa rosa]
MYVSGCDVAALSEVNCNEEGRFCCPTFNLPFCHSESSRGNTLHSGAEGFIIITIIIITPPECSQQRGTQ